jgi:hypothetical protein
LPLPRAKDQLEETGASAETATKMAETDFFKSIGSAAAGVDAEDDDQPMQAIESLCMDCHENVLLPAVCP